MNGGQALPLSGNTGAALKEAEVQAPRGNADPSVAGDDDTNVWPTETEEAAFLAESAERGEKVVPVVRDAAEEIEDDSKALPKLDELVERIPAETRELLDELFRARFVAVRRVRKKDLKI